jgi:hypothetical protein
MKVSIFKDCRIETFIDSRCYGPNQRAKMCPTYPIFPESTSDLDSRISTARRILMTAPIIASRYCSAGRSGEPKFGETVKDMAPAWPSTAHLKTGKKVTKRTRHQAVSCAV